MVNYASSKEGVDRVVSEIAEQDGKALAGQVNRGGVATKNRLKIGVHSRRSKSEGTDFGIGGNALE